MRKSKIALLLGALLSLFVLAGCPSPANNGGVEKETVTVTFNNNGRIEETITLESGACLSSLKSYQLPTNPSKLYNYFLYWSESKKSQATAIEFDYNKPIQENITLYAIYTPSLSSIKILNSTQIEIDLYDSAVFPLEDGSYAGLKLQHSNDDNNYQDVTLGIPSKVEDGYYRYLTYTFDSPLEEGLHYFKVSNGHETKKSDSFNYIRPENIAVLTFLKADSSTAYTREVKKGEHISDSEIPSASSNYYNFFMYWSESKNSVETAVEYDFTAPVMDNKTLYPIYTPRLYSDSSSTFESISYSQIEISLYSTNVYSLADGSYAGLNFQYSTDKVNYQNLEVISVPAESRDESSHRNLTFTYANNFHLPNGEYYFKVSNGKQTATSSKTTISAPSAVTNLSAVVNDSYAKISFETTCYGSSYKVTACKNDTEIASKTISVSSSGSTGSVEFFGLTNGTTYTFKVNTKGSDFTEQINVTPEIIKKESDWVVAMYMDGDNDLNDQIYRDMNEAEYGLYLIRKTDGITPETDFASVNVVALWDGAVSWTTKDKTGNDITVTPKIGKAGTYIFELGTDYSNYTSTNTSSGNVLSDNTKNLSYTADWIVGSEKSVSTEQPTSCGEVDMGKEETLEQYLKWVKAHYSANKGIILQFSNHGGGPRSARYVETADGRIVKVGDTSGRRAICWDYSSGKTFLKTKDVSTALKEAGFADEKASIILMDLCLGSSIEDAYQFKDYAKYYAASPNTIPGIGLNYVYFMKSFTKNIETEALAKQILVDYRQQYAVDNDMWDSFAQQYLGNENASYSNLTTDQKKFIEWISDYGVTTFTITDLSKMAAVKDAINELCDVLLSEEGKAKTVFVDDNGVISATATEKTVNYVSYLGQHHANIVNLGTTGYYINDSMYYMGTYTWLYDIGFIALNIESRSRATLSSGGENINAWKALNTAATNVLLALNEAVKYSWRDSKVNSLYNNDFYYNFDGVTNYEHFFGLTICGSNIAANGGNLVQGTAPDFYKTDLAFGEDSKWGDLLEYWFGK